MTYFKSTVFQSVVGTGETRKMHQILVGKRPLGRPTYRLDSSGSGQGLVVSSCEHSNEPSDSTEGGEFLG
jgi:hypothetical protein